MQVSLKNGRAVEFRSAGDLNNISVCVIIIKSQIGVKYGVYSGRIAPGEAVRLTATEADTVQGACPVTVYWVWVPWYSDIFSAESTLMAEADRAQAAAYYADGTHADEMFREGLVNEQGFNEADYIIGTTLKYICFDLTVQGE